MSDLRPQIAVSSCLLGNPVRYDGTDKRNDLICSYLSTQFEIIAICPEVGAGLGIPRPPIRLTGNPQQLSALGVEDAKQDVTAVLESFTNDWLSQAKTLSGLILKSRSPSCGLRDTPLFDSHGEIQSRGPGLFTQALIQRYPQLPVDDEVGIADPQRLDIFINNVKLYAIRQKTLSTE